MHYITNVAIRASLDRTLFFVLCSWFPGNSPGVQFRRPFPFLRTEAAREASGMARSRSFQGRSEAKRSTRSRFIINVAQRPPCDLEWNRINPLDRLPFSDHALCSGTARDSCRIPLRTRRTSGMNNRWLIAIPLRVPRLLSALVELITIAAHRRNRRSSREPPLLRPFLSTTR